MSVICPGCQRSVEPLERLEKDGKKTWCIKYCPNTRCHYNIDLELANIKVWNDRLKYFEDLSDS